MISGLRNNWRITGQHLLPEMKPLQPAGSYDIYPALNVGENRINKGFEPLAEAMLKHKSVIIDGYAGVFFDHFSNILDSVFKRKGKVVSWNYCSDYLKDPEYIEEMISPFTGWDDPVFGKRATLELSDFYDLSHLKKLKPDTEADISIIIGPGAALAGWTGLLVYIDLPKNEIQYRSRAGSTTNLGSPEPSEPKLMYKRFYFIDWIVLNSHKRSVLNKIDLFVDGQHPESPFWMSGELLRHSLSVISRNVFRVRPWFEPGTWGGNWIMENIRGLNKNVPNYAWSFELIVPENGLLFESSGRLMEVSFDCLMYLESQAVLGDCHARFGTDFPIRFDFLDTFNGGNLSIQCHPRPGYMKTRFGEDFTQEESYYILDTKDNAVVYLGFQDNIDPMEFKNDLEKSFLESKPVEVEKYIQKHRASKHELFLIPSGTIHGSGENNLVLEISSTPYIFTFKMYDWLRPDLDGKPRPLNIERGMENLYFDRKGAYVREKLISRPKLIDKAEGWNLYHLPTHETHLYDVHRLHLKGSATVKTENKCHVLSLVEGSSILIETENGYSQEFSYAETFVIPAAANSYKITNKSGTEAIVVKAFVK